LRLLKLADSQTRRETSFCWGPLMLKAT